jgi:adenylate kinase
MYLIMLGAPGVGKGTQAKMIMEKYQTPQISTGEILRKEVNDNSTLGQKAKIILQKGELVPDDIMLPIVEKRLQQPDCQKGFILDGFPRTLPQAEGLDQILENLNITDLKVIDIYGAEEEIITRLTSRRICSNCGADYNLQLNPPPEDGRCLICGGNIIQRDDDKVETIKNRLDVYREQTAPLISYYQNSDKYYPVDGLQSIEQVFKNIVKILT